MYVPSLYRHCYCFQAGRQCHGNQLQLCLHWAGRPKGQDLARQSLICLRTTIWTAQVIRITIVVILVIYNICTMSVHFTMVFVSYLHH